MKRYYTRSWHLRRDNEEGKQVSAHLADNMPIHVNAYLAQDVAERDKRILTVLRMFRANLCGQALPETAPGHVARLIAELEADSDQTE